MIKQPYNLGSAVNEKALKAEQETPRLIAMVEEQNSLVNQLLDTCRSATSRLRPILTQEPQSVEKEMAHPPIDELLVSNRVADHNEAIRKSIAMLNDIIRLSQV